MAAAARTLDIAAAVGAGARFLVIAWRGAAPALGLASLAFGAWSTAPADPIWLAVAGLTGWVAQGAAWRVAFDWIIHRGGLHIGHVEWRLAVASLLTAAFLAISGLLGLVILLAGAYAVASAGEGFVASHPETWPLATAGRGRWLLGALALAEAAALVLISARLSLAAAATAARGRVQVLATWARTRGQAPRLLAVFAILAAAPLALFALAQAARASPLPPLAGGAVAFIAGATAAGVWLPLSVGCAAYAWRIVDPAAETGAPDREARR